ncbi:MAG: family acetyltransferase [Crocinitomicaceae bacterium]|jgi:RimJ/RimL family protein N-acetyltransferase|nr:family acetyltransferase [Crocinitomicaceae bacterium]
MKQILETERLLIREFTPDDTHYILEQVTSDEWLRFIGDRKVYDLADARHYLVSHLIPPYETKGFGFYAVDLKSEKKTIGMCGLVKRDELEDIDIGFAFLPAYFGLGYAYESSKAVLDYALQTLKKERICAITLAENQLSIKLLKKLGLQYKKQVFFGDPHEELMLFEIEAVKKS